MAHELHIPDFVQVTIDGVDRTEYVISYGRHSSLCEIGDSFTLELSPDYPVSLLPYNPVIIKELYDGNSDNVLRGYITNITQEFDPGSFVVQGSDKTVLLFDYFISEPLVSNGESVDYWIQYLANLVGLSVQFNATSPAVVEAGTPLGLQTVGELIRTLERQAAYFLKYDSTIDSLIVFRLETSEPQMTINQAIEAIREMSTEKTRNVVKVYGGFKFNLETEQSEQVFATARTEIPELITDKTIVVSNPVLNKQTYAYIVASRILNLVNSVDDLQIYQLDGFYPGITIGDITNIDWSEKWDYVGSRMITSIEVSLDTGGAVTNITIGEKCPRISISLPPSPVFVSTISGGVGVSWDAGDTFSPSNLGLTGTALNVYNIAANNFGQQMIVTEDGVYKRPTINGFWTKATALPDPINSAEDSPPITASGITVLKAVEEPSTYNTFHLGVSGAILASGESPSSGELLPRSWIYTTRDLGNSWSSFQLYHPLSGQPTNNYSVSIRDMESNELNQIVVLTEDFSKIVINPIKDFYFLYQPDGQSSLSTRLDYVYSGGRSSVSNPAPAGYRWRSVPGNRDFRYRLGYNSFFEHYILTKVWSGGQQSLPVWSGYPFTDGTATSLGDYLERFTAFGMEESPEGNTVKMAATFQDIVGSGDAVDKRFVVLFFEDDITELSTPGQATMTKVTHTHSRDGKVYCGHDGLSCYTVGEHLYFPDENTTYTADDGYYGIPQVSRNDIRVFGDMFNCTYTSDEFIDVMHSFTYPKERHDDVNFGDWPGDLFIETCLVNIPSKSISTASKRIVDFMTDTSPIDGPIAASEYPHGPLTAFADGSRYIVEGCVGGQYLSEHYFAISILKNDGDGTQPNYCHTLPMKLVGGNISVGNFIDISSEVVSDDFSDSNQPYSTKYMVPVYNLSVPGAFAGTWGRRYANDNNTYAIRQGWFFGPNFENAGSLGGYSKREGTARGENQSALPLTTSRPNTFTNEGEVDILVITEGEGAFLFFARHGLDTNETEAKSVDVFSLEDPE